MLKVRLLLLLFFFWGGGQSCIELHSQDQECFFPFLPLSNLSNLLNFFLICFLVIVLFLTHEYFDIILVILFLNNCFVLSTSSLRSCHGSADKTMHLDVEVSGSNRLPRQLWTCARHGLFPRRGLKTLLDSRSVYCLVLKNTHTEMRTVMNAPPYVISTKINLQRYNTNLYIQWRSQDFFFLGGGGKTRKGGRVGRFLKIRVSKWH